ncbi:MAG: DUF58 domain-containing protein [Gemmataceae bacterium]
MLLPWPRVSIWLTAPGLGWLAVAFGAMLAGLAKNINLILLVSYFLLGIMLWNAILARRTVRGLTIRRRASPLVFAGEDAACEYEIVNRSSQAAVEITIQDRPFDQDCSWPVATVAARTQIDVARLASARKRGRYEARLPAIVCAAPFGLVKTRIRGERGTTAWVFPRRGTIDLDRLRLRLPATGVGRERRRALVPLPAEETDIHGLRPFRTGDSPRLIHWKTTARVGQPMVREFDRNAAPDLFVAMDTDWVRADRTGSRFEAALEFLATLAWFWSAKTEGTLTLSIARGAEMKEFRISNRADSHRFLRALAEAELPTRELRGAISYDAVSERTPVVVIGDSPVSGHRGLAVDVTKATDFYRPPS